MIDLIRTIRARIFFRAHSASFPTFLALLLAGYTAVALNAPFAWDRFASVSDRADVVLRGGVIGAELWLVFSATLALATLLGLLGRRVLRWSGLLLIVASAAAAYFMVHHGVVIGYGAIAAVLNTDHTLSGDVIGVRFVYWVLLLGVIPATLWWLLTAPQVEPTAPARTWAQRAVLAATVVVALASALLAERGLKVLDAKARAGGWGPSPAGTAAHKYVPTNWVSASAMLASNSVTQYWRERNLKDPADLHHYGIGDDKGVYVVLVIGESLRYDHMQLFGYPRDTTPKLAAKENLVAIPAQSCDTSTRLSLACMFVRPEGIVLSDGFRPDKILEDNVFSVFRSVGYSIELFSMQAEAGFYQRVGPDLYRLREELAAQFPAGEQAVDAWLLPEVSQSLARHPDGRHLIVLHQKGSHYLYSARHPREFARFTPECLDTDDACTDDQLRNSYDNSVLYTDAVLADLKKRMAHVPALVIVTSDHGQSIGSGARLHGTPRAVAPAEQRRVPMLFWASDPLLQRPQFAERFEQLRERASNGARASHANLFATLLGCAGIDSPDGGVNQMLNLCARRPS